MDTKADTTAVATGTEKLKLETEIYTDEDLDTFLKRFGILVIDVFSWAGPCVGMIGYLKKAKLELGGDYLHLAIARSDTVEKLKRFRNRSEPTWLFCSNGRVIKIMLGCNVPKLMAIITQELKNEEEYRNGQFERVFYEFDELLPEEKELEVLKRQQEEETERLEIEQAIHQRKESIRNVTDTIMEHISDMGITMFMPHIMKDAYRKTADIADKMELACKDRKCVKIKPEMIEVLHYEIDNPLPDEILQYLFTKEVLLFLWKLGDTDTRTPEEVLNIFHKTVAVPNKVFDESGERIISQTPAILESAEYVPGYEPVIEVRQNEKRRINTQAGKKAEPPPPQVVLPTVDENGQPIKRYTIPPCWTPQNKRANAAFIYIFFRNVTEHFLPPDVPPTPQHLLFVFDAYKRHNIFEMCKPNLDDVLAYGYFSSEDIGSCTLLAKTTEKYDTLKPTVNDKLMMKIAKKRSDIVARLSEMGPCYVSVNTIDGKADCDKLFPPDYNVPEEEEQENDSCEGGSKKKRKKRRKKREKADGEADQSQSQTADQMSVQDSEDTLDDLSNDEEELNDEKEENNAPPPSPNPP